MLFCRCCFKAAAAERLRPYIALPPPLLLLLLLQRLWNTDTDST